MTTQWAKKPLYEMINMKVMKLANLLGLGLVLTVPVVGCKSTNYGVTKLNDRGKGGTGSELPSGGTVKPAGEGVEGNPVGLPDPNLRKDWPRDAKIFEADTAHFDYDSTVIRADDKPKVAAVADYLKANALDALEIDGHADERGTEEYNRALGERRALALREELIRLGIDATRIDTASFGKDRPVDTGHNEAAHKKNRRGEFLLEVHPK